jgi:plastocyanin
MTSAHRIRRGSTWFALSIVLATCAACGSGARPARVSATPHHTARTTSDVGPDEIAMRLIAFRPDELDVAIGTTVTWTQQDAGFHTVTSGTVEKLPSGSVDTHPDGTFASGRVAAGETFSFAFDEAGTYSYFCELHPATMSGRVTAA